MSFDSLSNILKKLQQEPSWDQYHRFQHLLQCWQKSVSPNVSRHTRPLHIARKVLWVATSSSTWSQTLSLQRFTLLKKLNTNLAEFGESLDDIRFSVAYWTDLPHHEDDNVSQSDLTAVHPSYLGENRLKLLENSLSEGNTPQSAFQRWAEELKKRSQILPLCPQCQAPTPSGELQRWGVCCHCLTKPK
jgi:predicted nucleic acid-binding Zn ribbon protein